MAAFSDVLRLGPEFSDNRDELVRQLPCAPGANTTRLYDALAGSLDAFGPANRRRVLIVFSDGADTASSLDRDAVIARAREADAMIYAIGLTSRYIEGGRRVVRSPDVELQHMANETGGGYVDATNAAELRTLFERIADELHRQYLFAFTPIAADGRVHALAFRATCPGCVVHARRSYVAPKARVARYGPMIGSRPAVS